MSSSNLAQNGGAEGDSRPEQTAVEDSNNNTSLIDRERSADAPENESSRQSPAVREIHKNSWLKKMPNNDKWPGKFPKSQKLEKFWVVFCVHDDKEAFLEFYENRRSAYSHMPLTSVSLSKCLHISPTIVAQGNDHEFVITLESEVIRLAASTNEQMLEWMDTLSTKLRELGVLEPKDNLYSKEPISYSPLSSISEFQSREDMSRLSLRDPNSPLPPVPPPSAVVYIRNPSVLCTTPESVFSFDVSSEQDSVQTTPLPSPVIPDPPVTVISTTPPVQSSLYEPLFSAAIPSVSLSVRNPSYENPPHPQRHIVFKPTPALPPRSISQSADSSVQGTSSDSPPLDSTHRVWINLPMSRTQGDSVAEGSSHERLSHNVIRPQASSGYKSREESSKPPVSLRAAQVQKLQSEMQHKSGVRLMLRKKDCLNAVAFVEHFNHVWIAGWKQKEHPLLHNTFHVGDRLISIAGTRIQCVQDAQRAIKQQSSTVEFIVRRVPYGKILAIRREYEGQDLGLVREGGTAEIKEVKGLAARQGLPLKASSLDGSALCNWVLTEINHRPLNLFFKEQEVEDRLNAVGLDISLLVQPLDLVKALKKQLKAMRSYKEFIVQ